MVDGNILLDIRGINVEYQSNTNIKAVNDVSFSLAEKEILAIVGESGSGKSTIGQSLLGLLPHYAKVNGDITIHGTSYSLDDIRKLRELRGKQIGIIFQDPYACMDPVFTVGQQLEETIRVLDSKSDRHARQLRVSQLLEMVHLDTIEHIRDRYPHELSGGQLQRIMIAIALAGHPKILIADEPTTALDANVQQEILDLLYQICYESDVSIILITHDMGVVADLANRIIVMRNGSMVEKGDVDSIFHHPENAYTRQLLASFPAEKKSDEPQQSEETSPLLDVHNLTVSYRLRSGKIRKAVHNVSFSIRPKEILALVGPSGSGKSTIMRSLLGLNPLSTGSINVDGQDINALSDTERKQVQARFGVIFQSPSSSLNPRLRVGDLIAEPLRYVDHHSKDESWKIASELLETVGLSPSLINRYPNELSGGQRQRVSIARAISLKPSLLIADEPTSALDSSVQAEVLDLLRKLQEEIGFGCLFISHDLRLVRQFSHRTIILNGGTVVDKGQTQQLFDHPDNEYVRELIDSSPVPDPTIQRRRRLQMRTRR